MSHIHTLLVLSLLSGLSFSQTIYQYQLHSADSSVLIGASQACLNSYNANVSCPSTVGRLYGNAFLDLSDSELSALCTSNCFTSLVGHRNQVASNCGSPVEYYDDADGSYWASTTLDDQAIYAYNLTCLRNGATYCNSWFQSLNNDSASASTSSSSACNPCYLNTILMQADSPFGSGGSGLTSMYKSLSSSCSFSGPTPTSPSSLLISSPTATANCSGSTYTIEAGDTYNSIAKSQGVATVQLLQSNGLSYNASDFPKSGTLCITNKCSIYVVLTNDTCDSISSAANISTVQLHAWNLNINGLCSNLANLTSQSICLSNPLGNDYLTMTIPPSAATATTPAPIPATVAPNVTKNCGEYYQVVAGDSCATVTLEFGISLEDFYFLNPSVDANCTNLWLNYSYCIEAVGSISTYPGYGGTASRPPITPASKTAVAQLTPPAASLYTVIPLANGTRTDCWDYIWINDTANAYNCWDMAAANGLDPEEFALWNPSIDTNAEDSTNSTYNYPCTLKPSQSYCYNVASPAPATAFSIQTPAPISSGQPVNCTTWVELPSSNVTCSDLLSNLGIGIAELYAMNPSIKSDCTGMAAGTYYCISTNQDGTPGTTSMTSVTATITATGSSSGSAPGPTQSGIISTCNKYLESNPGGSCSTFASRANITTAQLYAWNSILGPNGANCTTNFWASEYYCVGVSASASVSSSTKPISASTTQITAPGPTQTGIISTCNAYLESNPGGTCTTFASRAGITVAQLYAWNSILGANGENCATNFWASEYYCVGVSATSAPITTAQKSTSTSVAKTSTTSTGLAKTSTTSTSANKVSTTTTVAAPGPTQTGIAANCNAYGMANPGGTCTAFASRFGITTAQLYSWNPVLGSTGQNCATSFLANEYYCVGVKT